ncbi:MAG TPA: hypothetical protein VNU48_12675 [Burkholderiaceae bacterium]|nr:hypothetical protein [Burkholderiaceae bacterium]
MATHTLPPAGDSGPPIYYPPDLQLTLTGAEVCPCSELHSTHLTDWSLSFGAIDARNAVPTGSVRGIGSAAVFGIDFCVRFSEPMATLCEVPAAAPAPSPPDPPRVVEPPLSPAERRALQRRLDRWELDHLREHAAALAERLETLEAEAAELRRARDDAEDRAGFWHDQTIGYYHDEQERGAVVGLAVDGTLSIVTPPPHR